MTNARASAALALTFLAACQAAPDAPTQAESTAFTASASLDVCASVASAALVMSPDGRYIVVGRCPIPEGFRLERIEVATGATTVVDQFADIGTIERSPSGDLFYLREPLPGSALHIYSWDLTTTRRVIDVGYDALWSADGSLVAGARNWSGDDVYDIRVHSTHDDSVDLSRAMSAHRDIHGMAFSGDGHDVSVGESDSVGEYVTTIKPDGTTSEQRLRFGVSPLLATSTSGRVAYTTATDGMETPPYLPHSLFTTPHDVHGCVATSPSEVIFFAKHQGAGSARADLVRWTPPASPKVLAQLDSVPARCFEITPGRGFITWETLAGGSDTNTDFWSVPRDGSAHATQIARVMHSDLESAVLGSTKVAVMGEYQSRTYDLATGALLASPAAPSGHFFLPSGAAFSEDDDRIFLSIATVGQVGGYRPGIVRGANVALISLPAAPKAPSEIQAYFPIPASNAFVVAREIQGAVGPAASAYQLDIFR